MNGIRVVDGTMDSLATIESGIQRIGEAIGRPGEAEELWSRIDSELDAVRDAVADEPKVPTLLVMSREKGEMNQLFSAGSASFVSELLEIAGGQNVFAEIETPYFEASKERVVAKAPEAVLELHPGEDLGPEAKAEYIADWGEMPTLPAVQSGRVRILTGGYLLIPGPRVPQTARRIAEALHPEAFPEAEQPQPAGMTEQSQ